MEISLIIPTYNPGSLLEECLKTVDAQTFPHSDFEVLVVLNGDVAAYRDSVRNLAASFGNLDVKVLESEPAGVSRARNLAVSMASGKYLAFVDDDDLISENFLQTLYDHADEDTVVISNVYGFYRSVDERVPDYMTYRGLTGNPLKDRRYWNNVCNKLIPARALSGVHFDVKLWQGEDALVMFTASRYLNHLCVEPEAIYHRRLRQGSLSRSNRPWIQVMNCKIRQILGYLKAYVKAPCRYNFLLFASRFVAVIRHK